MYQIKNNTAEISIKEYLNKYVDIPTFLKCCRECPNFNHKWSCPPYDFDVESYWKQYTSFLLVGRQIIFNEETRNRTFSQEDMDLFIEEIVAKENSVSRQRTENVDKAYYHCHTDITIPYDELGSITVVTKDGREIELLKDGKFVLPGTEILNEPLNNR